MSLIKVNFEVKAFKNKDRFYFISKTTSSIETMDVTCSHRGGPLLYGKISDGFPYNVTCPWHNMITPKKRLCKMTVPTIKVEDKILIILKKVNFKVLNYGIKEL